MNLIESTCWIPVRRQSGKQDRIAPWQITETDDPIVGLAAPRHDFNAGLFQFLLALLQTAVPPKDISEWDEQLETPLIPEQLRKRFSIFAGAFNLFDEHHPFMQDLSIRQEDQIERQIDSLLIENNEIHFNKPGRISGMCVSCATTALFTLQTNAPEGGRGHYTSIRGGGPLTTFVVFDSEANEGPSTLWINLWLNVLQPRFFAKDYKLEPTPDQALIFPWLDSTRYIKVQRKKDVFPEDIHPLQMLWAMPRRIVLQREEGLSEICGICGQQPAEVHNYHTRPTGISYSNEPVWDHPWSPHYLLDKKGNAPRHPQPGGFSYRHWPELVTGEESHSSAQVVSDFQKHRMLEDGTEQLRVWAFGYDMKSNKARCWYETTLPLYYLPESIRSEFAERVDALAKTAAEAADYTRSCVKDAWFARPADAKGDMSFITRSYFERTERDFFGFLERLRDCLQADGDSLPLLHEWHGVLRRTALRLFEWQTSQGGIENGNPRRIAKAYDKLNKLLYSNTMRTLLQMPKKAKEVTP